MYCSKSRTFKIFLAFVMQVFIMMKMTPAKHKSVVKFEILKSYLFFYSQNKQKEKNLAKRETKAIIFKIFKINLKNSRTQHSEIDS